MRERALVYDADAAARYARTRALPAAAAKQWRAVLAGLPAGAPVRRVLDAGCGSGRFLPVLAAAFPQARVVGVEPSAEMRRLAAGEVVAGALPNLPFPDAAFEFVWLSMVLHHCPDPAAALEECRRVLAPDGVIALRTGTRGTVDSFEFLRFYPSALAKERTSMPAAATLSEWVSRAGLIVAERREVHQRIWSSYEDYRDRVLGHGFPSLAFCPPEELAAGDAAFTAHCRARAGGEPEPERVALWLLASPGRSAPLS